MAGNRMDNECLQNKYETSTIQKFLNCKEQAENLGLTITPDSSGHFYINSPKVASISNIKVDSINDIQAFLNGFERGLEFKEHQS